MSKRKKKKNIKSRIRIFASLIIFGSVTIALGYNCLSNILMIKNMNKEKKELENQLVILQEKNEELESYILKLEDPEYFAKYVREKLYYSKDGEIKLMLD